MALKKQTVYLPVEEDTDISVSLPKEIVETWEPIYKEEKQLPKINGYEGKIVSKANCKCIQYGCAEIMNNFFLDLLKISEVNNQSGAGNRSIKSIKLDSGVEITIEQVREIVEYLNEQK